MNTNFSPLPAPELPNAVKKRRVGAARPRTKRTVVGALAILSIAAVNLVSWEQTNAGAILQRRAPRAESVATVLNHQFSDCGITWCATAQIPAGEPFQSLVVEWPKEEFLEARILDSGRWTPWTSLVGESDVRDGESAEDNAFFFSAHVGTQYQLRKPTSAPGHATVRMFTVPSLPEEPRGHDVRISSLGDNEGPTLLSRSQWLGDLALSQEKLESLWPPEYEEIKKIIIHHTASTVRDVNGDGALDGSDYRELVRAIYHYHASSKKWGDIGYQYIIDPDGTIYEGRFGGDGVVGGHAYRSRACTKFGPSNMPFNKGTIGVSILGTYQDQSISLQAHEALTTLIAEKAWEFEFEPSGSSFFQDKIYPNIIAHRDVDCTSCPGDTLYSTLSEISNISQQKFDLASQTRVKLYHAELLPESVPTRITFIPGQPQTISVRFRNTGTATWRQYGSQKLSLAPSSIKESLASLESVRLAALNDTREEGGRDLTNVTSSPKEDPSIRLVQPNVAPGEIGTFELTISDPPPELESERSYVLALGNRGWFADGQISFEIENAGLPWAGTRVIDEGDDGSVQLAAQEKNTVLLKFTNRGTKEWRRGDVVLRLKSSHPDQPILKDRAWKKEDGQFVFKEKEVKPGEAATFSFPTQPLGRGAFSYDLELTNKDEPVSGSDYLSLEGEVRPRREARVRFVSFPKKLLKGEKAFASVTVENAGLDSWEKPVLVGLAGRTTRPSVFTSGPWAKTGIAETDEPTGQDELANFVFELTAPAKLGSHETRFFFKDGKKKIPLVMSDGVAKEFLSTKITVAAEKKPVKKKATKK